MSIDISNLSYRDSVLIHIFAEQKGKWLLTEALIQGVHTQKVRVSDVTLRRDLSKLVKNGFLQRKGKARSTQYRLNPAYQLLIPIDEEAYFSKDVDERDGNKKFNFEIFKLLSTVTLFSKSELQKLLELRKNFKKRISKLSDTLIRKEYERITIELSWKSSAIEGNTYSLLETETLLKEGIEAEGKDSKEAQMILNHKTALEFVRENICEFGNISLPLIEKLHSLLVTKLDVSTGFRERTVAITGSTYTPIENRFQIIEAVENSCNLINQQNDGFSKAMLALLLISYIQPFEDGNKRTSRLISNALLLANDCFPLSFRSVKIQEYKKAILLFYELNYLPFFKRIFLEQVEFAAEKYFRL